MRSRADRRVAWERAARGAALVLVGVVLWRLLLARDDACRPVAHLAVVGEMSALTRDSLAARARAGDAVTWSGDVAAVATAAEPTREPAARVRISAVSDGALALGDSLDELDSLPAGGGTITVAGLRGTVHVRDGLTVAHVVARAGAAAGRVFVLGRVGWESKFTIAALEEEGWSVDARLRLSDSLRVTQGRSRVPVFGTHTVVIALDTALGADAEALTRFVRAGGGLVLAGEAASAPARVVLAPARAGVRIDALRNGFDGDAPPLALPFLPLSAQRADAVVLERRDGSAAVVARRVAAGRVLQSAYAESWRWRMQGGASGAQAHREWWTRLVAAAAAQPVATASRAASHEMEAESAPRAALVHQLGRATPGAPTVPPVPRPLPAWLGAITLALLVAEWASRRTRGAA